ncbi:unnamed protein product [Prunus armeniaca]
MLFLGGQLREKWIVFSRGEVEDLRFNSQELRQSGASAGVEHLGRVFFFGRGEGVSALTSESSSRESHDPPAFGGKDTKSEEPSQYVCSEGESSETKVMVEGVIESRMVVYEGERGEPSVDSGSAAYREMQRNYKVLEAITD